MYCSYICSLAALYSLYALHSSVISFCVVLSLLLFCFLLFCYFFFFSLFFILLFFFFFFRQKTAYESRISDWISDVCSSDLQDPRKPCIAGLLEGRQCPAIVATGYIRAYVPMHYTVLGTDGYGRSDTRADLRRHFEVDRFHVAQAAISALAASRRCNDWHWPLSSTFGGS